MSRRARRLLGDTRGAAIMEFAFVAPVMLLLLMGMMELLYQEYVQSVLAGEVQKAARDSGIEGGAASTATIDGIVIARLKPIMKNLTNSCATSTTNTPLWCSTRKSYDTFTEVAPEAFVDKNGDGIRNAGECFTDVNGNGTWDADPGTTGQGGASAITSYTMTIVYPRLFPLAKLVGWSTYQKITATTLLKNQPYASQTTIDDTTVCT